MVFNLALVQQVFLMVWSCKQVARAAPSGFGFVRPAWVVLMSVRTRRLGCRNIPAKGIVAAMPMVLLATIQIARVSTARPAVRPQKVLPRAVRPLAVQAVRPLAVQAVQAF